LKAVLKVQKYLTIPAKSEQKILAFVAALKASFAYMTKYAQGKSHSNVSP
jgi:hypothetical protein